MILGCAECERADGMEFLAWMPEREALFGWPCTTRLFRENDGCGLSGLDKIKIR